MQDGGRQERIYEGSKQEVTQPVPTSATARAPGGRFVCVLRSIDHARSVLRWQRLRYVSKPPVEGHCETYGPIEDGYPLECAALRDYDIWVWGTGAPDKRTVSMEAVKTNGYWLLRVIYKPDGSPMDPAAPMSGFSG